MNKVVLKRLAKSIFEISKEQGKADEAFWQLKAMSEVMDNEREVRCFFSDYSVPKENKFKVVEETFSSNFETCVVGFLKLLVEKHMMSFLSKIYKEFKVIYYDYKNILETTVISVVSLSDSEKENLSVALGAKLGKKIELLELTDSSIIGGLIIKYENKMLDASLRGRLIGLRKSMVI